MIDLRKFKFSIIYSVDVGPKTLLAEYRPPNFQKKQWEVTESSDTENDTFENGGKHRKYCSILDFTDFCDFIEHVGIYVEKCQTMGSIGAPGFGFGCAPAVPFQSDDYHAYQCAYVTPIPPWLMEGHEETPLLPGMPEDVDKPSFEDVEQTMWEWFEEGAYSARDMAESLVTEVVA